MKGKEKRRFPRVQMQVPFGEVFRFLGARVFWPNNEVSDILDLSYKGMAARKPGVFSVKDKDVVKMLVELGDEAPYDCLGRVVWISPEWVGIEITSLSAQAHVSLRKFLDDSLLGQSLRRVDKEHYSSHSTFSYWFQAGSACHLFVWLNRKGTVERVQFDLNGEKIEIHQGQSVKNSSANLPRALRVLSQLQDSEIPIVSFIQSVSR